MNSDRMLLELKKQLLAELSECRTELDKVRGKSKWLNISIIILSAIITVLAGLNYFSFAFSGDVILLISAAVTAMSSIRVFFNYEKQIQHLAKTFYDLGLLDREVDLYINAINGVNSNGDVVTGFSNRFLSIIYQHANAVINFKNDKNQNIKESAQ